MKNTMKVLVTCPFGLASVLGNELKRLKMKPENSFERGTYVHTDWKGIYEINLWSRVANKVFLNLGEGIVKSFDDLFDLVENIDWSQYIAHLDDIKLQVVSKKSLLHSTRTIQSVAHKGVISNLNNKPTPNPSLIKEGEAPLIRGEVKRGLIRYKTTIYIHIEDDFCQIFVNTSGASLHERGRRTMTGEAPLKENVAAGLILLSGWRFKKKLLDPFCGSGTLLIEAAMIARNIAPGIQRYFAFEKFGNFDEKVFETLREEAKEKEYSGVYDIVGYDNDPTLQEVVLENAKNAGVEDTIRFENKKFEDINFISSEFLDNDFWIVSNPPYGKRIQIEDIAHLYQRLGKIMEQSHVFGGIISSYFEFGDALDMKKWSRKKLYNGADDCGFWWRKM